MLKAPIMQYSQPQRQPTTQNKPAQAKPVSPPMTVNSTAQFMQPVQSFMQKMLGDNAQTNAMNNRLAQNAQVQAAKQNAQMGVYFNRATGEMRNNFKQGSETLRQMMNDPYMMNLMGTAFNQAANPGLSKSTIDKMKGAAAAQNAADAAAGQRNLAWGMAGRGMSGASRSFQQQLMANRSANQLNRQLSNIDIEAEKFAKQDQGRAQSFAAQLLGERNNLGRAYAGMLQGYNPLGWMQQIQGMTQPFGQSAFNYGAMM